MQKVKSVLLGGAIAIATALPLFADETAKDFPVQLAYDKVTAGDIAGAIEYLTDNAVYVVIAAPAQWTAPAIAGKETIGQWWQGMHQDNARFEVTKLKTDGDRASFTGYYWGDRLEKIGMSPAEFDGVAVMREGKVRALLLSYSADYEPKLREAMAKLSK